MHRKDLMKRSTAQNPSRLAILVESYYSFVDAARLDDLLALFSRDIYYKRCRQEIHGIAQMEQFYREQRKLQGKHSNLHIIDDSNNIVVVEGSFDGQVGNQPISIQFVDLFFFNKQSKIYERHTYTDQGTI